MDQTQSTIVNTSTSESMAQLAQCGLFLKQVKEFDCKSNVEKPNRGKMPRNVAAHWSSRVIDTSVEPLEPVESTDSIEIPPTDTVRYLRGGEPTVTRFFRDTI
ncbi:hypothetical protein F2P81_000255 [Scophthalmus maximus]|uniref:Uncharacterized protein n=1 Tax=Scophthalmus maximus TaxID=52904 RepID=A0A6A4TX37_SCOMX|nr:hypothetical protein F2P81_000255 [Scophthalmus maximus]